MSATTLDKVNQIVEFADSIKAEDIEVLDVSKKTSATEYFVICTGTSDVHIGAIVDRVVEKMTEIKMKPIRVESGKTGWELVDFGDVVLHVMREERRQFYDLETLWQTIQPNPDLP